MWWLMVSAAAVAGTFEEHDPRRFYLARSCEEPVVREAAQAVVWFEQGSGFVVSPHGHVLTTQHVADFEGQRTEIRLPNGRWVDLEYVGGDKWLDVALYRRVEPVPVGHYIPLRTAPVRRGESVAVLGNPANLPIRVSFGTVLETQLRATAPGAPPTIGYTAATWWGSSGSAVIDRKGRAVGVHWGWDRAAGQPFAGVPMSHILRRFGPLADAVSGCPDPEGALTVALAVTAQGLRAELNGPERCTRRIRSVVWVNRDGAEVAASRRSRGRARVQGPRPLQARVRLDAGHEVLVGAPEPLRRLDHDLPEE